MTVLQTSKHYHKNEQGILVQCYHHCKHWFSPGFLAGYVVVNTILFPIEHTQWDHIWPFDYVGDWLDRTGHLQMWISYVWLVVFVTAIVYGLYWAVTHKDGDSKANSRDDSVKVPTLQDQFSNGNPVHPPQVGDQRSSCEEG